MNTLVKGTVKSVDAKGAVIDLGNDVEGYLRAAEISADRVEDATTRLAAGDEVEALITNIDRKNRSIQLSIRAKDAAEARDALDRLNADATAASGTLIPLGPGIIALGQGDTYTLSTSLLTAFDTTVAGLVAAAFATVISTVRRGWYREYASILEAAAEMLLETEKAGERA